MSANNPSHIRTSGRRGQQATTAYAPPQFVSYTPFPPGAFAPQIAYSYTPQQQFVQPMYQALVEPHYRSIGQSKMSNRHATPAKIHSSKDKVDPSTFYPLFQNGEKVHVCAVVVDNKKKACDNKDCSFSHDASAISDVIYLVNTFTNEYRYSLPEACKALEKRKIFDAALADLNSSKDSLKSLISFKKKEYEERISKKLEKSSASEILKAADMLPKLETSPTEGSKTLRGRSRNLKPLTGNEKSGEEFKEKEILNSNPYITSSSSSSASSMLDPLVKANTFKELEELFESNRDDKAARPLSVSLLFEEYDG